MNGQIEKLKSEFASIALEAKPLAEKSKTGSLTADENTQFDEIIVRLDAAKSALDDAIDQEEKGMRILELTGKVTEVRGNPANVNRDTAYDPDSDKVHLTPGQRFANSPELKEALKRGDKYPKTDPVKMPGLFAVRGDIADDLLKMGPEELRAVISSGTLPASALLPQVFPNIYRAGEPPLVMRDVLLNLTTQSDSLTVMQESSFTNAAAEVAEATTPATGAKPESDLTFTEVSFPVRWVAHWLQVTRQNLEDISFIRGYIDTRLLQGLARREDNQILNGNGTPPNITGLLQTSGILVLDAAYFTTNPVNDAGASNENANRLRRAITRIKLSSVGGAMPSFVVANPADVEEWDTVTDANRQYLFGGPAGNGITRMWGLPIVQSENITALTALVGDGTMAAVVDRKDAEIYTTDSHADYFIRNLFVLLAEERIALVVFRPSGFAKVTLAA
jgi:HK97 family phage major capsid protein